MKYTLSIFFIGFVWSSWLQAQPDNDYCLDAIRLNDVTKFCSKVGAYSTVDATFDLANGDFEKPICWANSTSDVWFKFVAIATDVIITVNGTTLKKPQIALYTGSCSSQIAEVSCTAGLANSNNTTIYKGGLSLGSSYLIRVNSNTGSNGQFQICVNNYNPPKDQNGDCATGTVLCDKSAFHVQSVTGFGFLRDEADNTCLDLDNQDPLNNQSESNSTWFKWTAKNNGTLSFIIQPDVIFDDLDFALFELTSLTDCSNKKLLRCIATGCELGKVPNVCLNQGCLGATGLKDNDNDFGENYNCDAGENGFAKSIELTQGKSYALIVNNYSSAGVGFFIEFGGTAEFQGPTANFDVNPNSGLKCDQAFTITDSSFFTNGRVTKYTWNFGDGATPTEINFNKGPHQITYNSFGQKTIVLVVESDKGCASTLSKIINVEPCCEDLPNLQILPIVSDLICNGIPQGKIQINGIGGTPEYQYSINNAKFKRQFLYTNLDKGNYILKIVDAKGCRDSTIVNLDEPLPIIVDVGPDLKARLGYEISLNGSYMPPINVKSFRWVPPDGIVCESCLSTEAVPPGTTQYKLIVTSDNGCVGMDSLLVEVSLDRALFIPNVFTPDRDSENKVFKLYGNRAIEAIESLRVFNRWGGVVYEGTNLDINDNSAGWDGTSNGIALPPGTYVYIASVRFVDKVTRIIKGDVTLLR